MNALTAPTLTGPAGSARPVTDAPGTPAQSASLATWLLYLPFQHPLWSHYLLGVCHLRSIPGVIPAVRQYRGAQYELLVLALDPKHRADPANRETLWPLSPQNYVRQFHDLTDDQARELGRRMVERFVNGSLLIEPQGIVGARELFMQTFMAIWDELKNGSVQP